MISVVCVRCGEELDEPGGLLIGPPLARIDSSFAIGMVIKGHLCVRCWGWLEEQVTL